MPSNPKSSSAAFNSLLVDIEDSELLELDGELELELELDELFAILILFSFFQILLLYIIIGHCLANR